MPVVEQDKNIDIQKIETAPYGTNAYILACRSTRDSVLIDAPGEAAKIIAKLEETNPMHILITHSHFDHTDALRELKDRLKIPVGAHPDGADKLPLVPDFYCNDGDRISFGKTNLRVIHTPGHTPGGLCFFYSRYLFSGDTLFPSGPGRTNTPLAFTQIIKSLKDKIFVLPENTIIYPGHGESTILKKEKDEFEVFSSRPHPPNLCGDVLWLAS
ncbi:MAG: MBL fold metallo-hydrolase [Candidatus Aminicenantes bacterium]|jgi:glyoxylase-like metal-dependent hydrolase (beta-lactamase superfamily II)